MLNQEIAPEQGLLPDRQARRLSRHWRWPAAVSVTALLLVTFLRLSMTDVANSDGASIVLRASDMLHGNMLLTHWTLSDISFYTTELPQYMLLESVFGVRSDLVHIAAAMTYTMALLLAAWIAKGKATGREAVVRMLIAGGLMLAPPTYLLLEPCHIGTAIPLMITFLVVDRCRTRWYKPLLVGLLLVWVEMADTLVFFAGSLPIAVVAAVHLHRRIGSRRHDAGLLAAAFLAIPVANGALTLIGKLGGFSMHPIPMQFITSDKVPSHVWNTIEAFLTLFGADFFGNSIGSSATLTGGPGSAQAAHVNLETLDAILHLAGVLIVAVAVWLVVRTFLRSTDRLAQLLTMAILANLLSFLFSHLADSPLAYHEISAVLPLAAVLTGRLTAPLLFKHRLLPYATVLLVFYALALGIHAHGRSVPAVSATATRWLAANGMSYGLGDYANANITTVDSRQRVQVRPVTTDNGRIREFGWDSKPAWYDPSQHVANFLVTGPGDDPYTMQQAAIATFGPPAQTIALGPQNILIWHKNILRDLG